MLVSDIDEPVVAAAARTPFEASRRVFVIESVQTLNEQAANRLLKTLEEPARVRAPGADQRPPRGRAGDDRLALRARALRRADARDDRERPAGRRERSRPRVRAAGAGRRGSGEDARKRAGNGAADSRGGVCARGAARRDGRAPLERPARRGAALAGTSAGDQVAAELSGELELAPSKERKKLEREAQDAQAPGGAASARGGAGSGDCGWPSCGCATSCACRRALRSSCMRWTGRRSWRRTRRDAPRRAREQVSSWCARRERASPSTSRRSWPWRRWPTGWKRRSGRGWAPGRRSRTP